MAERPLDLLNLLKCFDGENSELARQLAERDDAHAAAINRHVASLSGDQMVGRIKQIIYRHAQLVQAADRGLTTTGERALLVALKDFEGALVESLHWLISNGHGTDVPIGDDTLVFSMNGMTFGRMLGQESGGPGVAPRTPEADDDLWTEDEDE